MEWEDAEIVELKLTVQDGMNGSRVPRLTLQTGYQHFCCIDDIYETARTKHDIARADKQDIEVVCPTNVIDSVMQKSK
jgi:hypothetical protein